MQWQGAGTSSVRELASESPWTWHVAATPSARRSSRPSPSEGPTVTAPVTMGDHGLEIADDIEAKTIVIHQLPRSGGDRLGGPDATE